MGLETASFISSLVPTNPLSSDPEAQGDDHLRLIKAALQGSFPNSSRAFYLPTIEVIGSNHSPDAADHNKTYFCDTSTGGFTVTLPNLAAGDAGFQLRVMKATADANGVKVAPTSGTIRTRNGDLATARVGIYREPIEFQWDGSAWSCYKPGPSIGSVEEYYGTALPAGYLWADGATFVAADFAELNAALGTNVKPDRRGRVAAGRDDLGGVSAGVLTGATVVKTALGSETHTLTEAQLPSLTKNVSITATTQAAQATGANFSVSQSSPDVLVPQSAGISPTAPIALSVSSATVSLGSGNSHNNVQPTYTCHAIVRAC